MNLQEICQKAEMLVELNEPKIYEWAEKKYDNTFEEDGTYTLNFDPNEDYFFSDLLPSRRKHQFSTPDAIVVDIWNSADAKYFSEKRPLDVLFGDLDRKEYLRTSVIHLKKQIQRVIVAFLAHRNNEMASWQQLLGDTYSTK